MIISTTMILWTLFAAASVCCFMIGKEFQNQSRNEVIDLTIMYLVNNNLVRWKKDENGEIELLELDDK